MSLFHWLILRHLKQNFLRSILTIASIAVGVAVVVAIQLANRSSVRGFEAALNAIAGRTSLEITVAGVDIEETRLTELGWLREYGLVSPLIDADVLLRPASRRFGAGNEAEIVRLLGVDILRDQPFRDYRLLESDGRELVTTQEFLQLLTDSRAVVITAAFADRYGLEVGSELDLIAGTRASALVVRGVLGDEGPARVSDGNFALMDIAAAQWVLGRLGRVDRVDIRLTDGMDVDLAEQAIRERLPVGFSVGRPVRRVAQVERMLRAFHFNLTALSFVALLVGLFLVYNTVAVSVITRRVEIGILRTVGISRGTVLRLFLGEAIALALVGCVLGVPLGWVLAQEAVRLTSSTVSQFWVATAATVPPLDLGYVAAAFAIGLPLSMVAAAIPAAEAAALTPLATVRSDDHLDMREQLPRRFLVGALLLFLVGGWLATREPVGGLPVFGLLSVLAVVFGAVLLVPVVLFGFSNWGKRTITRWLNVECRLAYANLGSAIPRLSISVAALAVSLAMMVAIAIMVGSFRETVVYWVGQTLQADLYAASARQGSATDPVAISSEVEATIARHPAVVAIDGFASVDVAYGDSLIVVGSGRFGVLLEYGGLLFKAPEDWRHAMAGAVGVDAVVVSESFSLQHGKQVGDSVTLQTPRGPVPFRIAAVYFDYSNDRGVVVMDREIFEQHYAVRRPTGLSIYLDSGSDPVSVRDGILATLGPDRRVIINTNSALRTEVLRIFDSTFTITYALEVIAIVVSIFGVAAMLLTLVLDRKQEIAMLRLVGAERCHLRRIVMIEAGVLGIVSQAIGLVIGLVLSVILIYVINVQSFGWTIQFHIPGVFLVQSSLTILVATILAGLYPARVAGRFAMSDLSAEG